MRPSDPDTIVTAENQAENLSNDIEIQPIASALQGPDNIPKIDAELNFVSYDLEEKLHRNNLKLGFVVTGTSRVSARVKKGKIEDNDRRGFENIESLDVGGTRFDHHLEGFGHVCAMDLVYQHWDTIVQQGEIPKAIISHKNPDPDSIGAIFLYVSIRDGSISRDDPQLQKLMKFIHDDDLGLYDEINLEKPNLKDIMKRVREILLGKEKERYQVGCEILQSIITRKIDLNNIQPEDFKNVKIALKEKKEVNMTTKNGPIKQIKEELKIIDCEKVVRDAFKQHEADQGRINKLAESNTHLVEDGVKLLYNNTGGALNNLQLYQKGYSIVVSNDGSIFLNPKYAEGYKDKLMTLFSRLESEETKIRRNYVLNTETTQINGKFNNKSMTENQFLRLETIRSGYENHPVECGGNSNPWNYLPNYSYLVPPKAGTAIPTADLMQIISEHFNINLS